MIRTSKGGKNVSLGIDNLLLRGSSLRNTDWVYGQCVYQGHDTKIMMNSSKAKMKFSKVERLTNKMIAITLFMQFCLAFLGAFIGG